MSIFRSRKKSFKISEREPVYKVRYLGNVQTALMKGDGCVDKPTTVLWNNYMKTQNVGLEMELSVCSSGLKAVTKEQGLTEYRAHRISYCIAHPKFPRLFIWVYRHEGKKMKVELRCHAVLCKTEEKAKAVALQLHEKLTFALTEFMKEKTRRQTSRLALQRTNSLPCSKSGISGLPMRSKFLSTGQHFKPPVDRSPSAPKLGSISEDQEGEVISKYPLMKDVLEEEDEELLDDVILLENEDLDRSVDVRLQPELLEGDSDSQASSGDSPNSPDDLTGAMFDLEIGNDIEALKQDEKVQYQLSRQDDSDDDSSESGFSEQDPPRTPGNGHVLSASMPQYTHAQPEGSEFTLLTNGDVDCEDETVNMSTSLPPKGETMSSGVLVDGQIRL